MILKNVMSHEGLYLGTKDGRGPEYDQAFNEFDIKGTDTKLLEALDIDGDEIINDWYEIIKRRINTLDSDNFIRDIERHTKNKNHSIVRLLTDHYTNYEKSLGNAANLANNLQALNIKYNPTLLNKMNDELKIVQKEAVGRFRARLNDNALERVEKDKSDRKQDQFDLLRWEGEGGALAKENKFEKRLNQLLENIQFLGKSST